MSARRMRLVTSALVLSSAFVALAAAEAAVRLWVPVRNVGPSFTTYDSVYGKSLKRGFQTTRRTPEFTMSFTTNQLGYRGPDATAPLKSPVLFLGDSYTVGYGVNDGLEYPARIGGALQRAGCPIPVLNAGLGDNGNGRWLKFLRDRGPQLEPSLVVLQICGNDFDDNAREGLFSLSSEGRLVENPIPPQGWPRAVQQVLEAVPGLTSLHLIGLMRQALHKTGGVGESECGRAAASGPGCSIDADELTYRLIDTALEYCDRGGWPVVVLAVGVEGQRVGELRRRLGEHEIELLEVPSHTERPDLYYRVDRHWNELGHRWVADKLLGHLDASGLLSP
jgi:hypothetical protein